MRLQYTVAESDAFMQLFKITRVSRRAHYYFISSSTQSSFAAQEITTHAFACAVYMRHSNRGRQGHHRNINIYVLSFIHDSGVKSRAKESDRKHNIMSEHPKRTL
uniref:Uncharacterized protein n=1 Tax=Schizaphis graminum TaxID=13262 RepID=A0A2S2P407_SCHGA